MISPTGLGVRSDSEGDGAYGSKRGGRWHMGLDFKCSPFQDIVAPFDMIIERVSYPYKELDYQGIQWRSESMTGKMFYFEPVKDLVGHPVRRGAIIGKAQDISRKYGSKMQPHIHFQIDSFDPMILIKLAEALSRI